MTDETTAQDAPNCVPIASHGPNIEIVADAQAGLPDAFSTFRLDDRFHNHDTLIDSARMIAARSPQRAATCAFVLGAAPGRR